MKQLNNTAIYSFKVELFAVCYLNAALETLQSIFAGRLTALFFYSNDGEMNLTGNVSCHMRGSEYECLLPCLGIISWAIFLSGALRTFLHSFHFFQVTIANIIYSHLLFRHTVPCRCGRTCVTQRLYVLAGHESSIAQCLKRPTGILEDQGFDSS